MPAEARNSLADITEYRQTLLARPPGVVHGAAILLSALVITAIVWAAFTEADLVVVAQGRVRPVGQPVDVYVPLTGQPGEPLGRRVVEVSYAEGDRVQADDPLIRFDTSNLDYEIGKQKKLVESAAQEIAKIDELERAMERQATATAEKFAAELRRIEGEIHRAEQQRELAVSKGEAALKVAREEEERYRRALAEGAGTETELKRIALRAQDAEDDLAAARLPVDRLALEVQQRAEVLAQQELAARRQELQLQRLARERERDTAQAAVDELEERRRQSLLRAPGEGIVITAEVQPGYVVPLNEPVLKIAPGEGLMFEGIVGAADVGNLQPQTRVRVKIDAYNYQQYGTVPGRVEFISSDSGVVKDGQQGNAVFYFVRIALQDEELESGELRGDLKLGMTGRAEIVTGKASLLSLLFRKIRQVISLG
jgi:multidrug efflux pump subunit AcrA (membrane-fusion protein)